MKVFFLLVLLLLPSMALALIAEEKLPNPEQEVRAHHLFRQFRCMVCQSQSLGESDAPLARDLRAVIRERITLNETDEAITDYLHARYGDYILFAPKLALGTVLLWFGPFMVLIVGGLGVWYYIRKQADAD